MKAEARLLLLCSRAELTAGERDSLLRLLETNLDWQEIGELADRHAMVPLLYRHLNALGATRVPKAAFVSLWARYEAISRRNRSMAAELGRILQIFESNGVAAIPYKGPTLALLLYRDVAMREFGDLDILMRSRDVMRAKALLQAEGYVPSYPLAPAIESAFLRSSAQHHVVLVNDDRSIMVELHWKTDPDFPIESLDDAGWWKQLGSIELEGGTVRAFPIPQLLLILCLHGSKHRWSSLGWLVDVAELTRQNSAIEWSWIFDRAASLRCDRRLALGLRLAHSLLEAPLPEPARAWIRKRPQVEPLAATIASGLFEREGTERGAFNILRLNLRLYDSGRQRVAHCVNTILAPSLVEWSRWPLPRGLFFLYPPLRLARLTSKYLALASRSRTQRALEPHLPPGLEHHHRDRIRQVEAAVSGPHRKP